MQVITVCNRKGGMGKSTTVVNLARQWSKLGRKVLVVDLDSQGHATLGLLGLDYMAQPQVGVHQLINDQNLHLPEVIIQTEFESLSLLPADLNFNESRLVDDVTQLKQRIQSLPKKQKNFSVWSGGESDRLIGEKAKERERKKRERNDKNVRACVKYVWM